MNFSRKTLRIIILALILIFIIIAIITNKYNPIAAIVNNDVIRYNSFIKQYNQDETYGLVYDKKSALDNNITELLILQNAKSLDTNIPEELVDKQLSQLGSEEDIIRKLNEMGLTIEESKSNIRRSLTVWSMKEYITRDVQITETEAIDFFNKYKEDFNIPETRIIKTEINSIIETSTYSENDFQEVWSNQTITQEVFSVKNENTILGPYNIDKGTLYITILGINQEKQVSYEEVSEKVKEVLLRQKEELVYNEWLDSLKSQANIIIVTGTEKTISGILKSLYFDIKLLLN